MDVHRLLAAALSEHRAVSRVRAPSGSIRPCRSVRGVPRHGPVRTNLRAVIRARAGACPQSTAVPATRTNRVRVAPRQDGLPAWRYRLSEVSGMTTRKSNPTPKGRARWPLGKCEAQACVFEFIDGVPRSAARIAYCVGLTQLSTRAALRRLRARGLATNKDRKWYRV